MNLMKDNISEEEVRKFNKLALEWWDLDGSFSALHALNPLRFNYIKNWTELKNKKCLDIGCGGGILTESLSKYANHVDALDMSSEAISVAQNHQELMAIKNITYHQNNLESFVEVTSEKYDVLTCMEMLEHVPSPEKIIESSSKAVKVYGDHERRLLQVEEAGKKVFNRLQEYTVNLEGDISKAAERLQTIEKDLYSYNIPDFFF